MSTPFSIATPDPEDTKLSIPSKELQMISEILCEDAWFIKVISDSMHDYTDGIPPRHDKAIISLAMVKHLQSLLKVMDIVEGKV